MARTGAIRGLPGQDVRPVEGQKITQTVSRYLTTPILNDKKDTIKRKIYLLRITDCYTDLRGHVDDCGGQAD